ncbi:FeoA family protein [Salisediminibacterium beveridgei]|uniref:Ferrous iron transporter FeoA-like domain-containing protein n=1 Tax=Salisediminibacterium beveridgei TaxID=632773 RepID=A0A1D7QYC2_9BACI|nr:FeoA family protein [Salisediminibacterium beveridgei]AOM83978.1 hypothetical protein BBEV_2640 [Salisediminibacterium beveridgei]
MKSRGLCDLPCEARCRVKSLPVCPLLEGLGIHIGSELCIKHKSPWRGPVVVQTRGRREVAIDYAIASEFGIEELNSDDMP